MNKIYLAGGCFWGVEEYFSRISGVVSTTVGYANSDKENPTYKEICAHSVNAIETVLVSYDESILSLDSLLDSYFAIIDPTSIDKQGEDSGYQYRSGIYYIDDSQLETIKNKIVEVQKDYAEKVVVEVLPLNNFFDAEEYHQDYLKKNPNGYCHIKF